MKAGLQLLVVSAFICMSGCNGHKFASGDSPASAKAVGFLSREVPAWSRENGCYSCHNNGDGAKALMSASAAGMRLHRTALQDTLRWMTSPAGWDDNQGDPGFSDQRLANIQFAASLLRAVETKQTTDIAALRQAARRVAADQAEDGSWPVGLQETLGSPATYGSALASHLALRVLQTADPRQHGDAIRRGRNWLLKAGTSNVPNAAAVVMEFAGTLPTGESGPLQSAVEFLATSQNPDGGWGPYRNAPSEAFDTALALLALRRFDSRPEIESLIWRGRAHLIETQLADGSWPATTRPAGGNGYAQWISTTGWATQALIATEK